MGNQVLYGAICSLVVVNYLCHRPQQKKNYSSSDHYDILFEHYMNTCRLEPGYDRAWSQNKIKSMTVVESLQPRR
uniref:Uncharacterized protein n=1 Tax=Aegilops tauschii subsp. strangulata TaxID=200361 RepID=A0A452ZKR4_AEGTS